MMPGEGQGTQAGIPPHGMPAAATVDWVPMPRGGTLETLAAPLEDAAARDGSLPDDLVALASATPKRRLLEGPRPDGSP